MATVSDLLTDALSEIRVARAGDVPSPDDMALALRLFNELLDACNAEDRAIYTRAFTTFTLTANLQPHTIGVTANSPTLTVTIARPTRIHNANIVLTNNVRSPLELLNDQQWNDILVGAAAGQTPSIVASIPTGLYYDPAWPNGALYLWPVPSTAYGLELETDTLFAAVDLTDDVSLPPGYQQALRLTLAELMAPSLGQSVSPATASNARKARARIWGLNDQIPNLTTIDAGMPKGVSKRGGFNYLTGQCV